MSTPDRPKRSPKPKAKPDAAELNFDSGDDMSQSSQDEFAVAKQKSSSASSATSKKRKRASEDDDDDDFNVKDDEKAQEISASGEEEAESIEQVASTPKKRAKTGTPAAAAKKILKQIKGLEKKELLDVFTSLMASNPEVVDIIGKLVPEANEENLIQELNSLNRKVYKAMPHSRFGSTLDEYSYKRCKPATSAFKKRLREMITSVKDRGDWKKALKFFTEAIGVVLDLPAWKMSRYDGALILLKPLDKSIKIALGKKDLDLSDEDIENTYDAIHQEEALAHMEEAPDALKSYIQKTRKNLKLWNSLEEARKAGQ